MPNSRATQKYHCFRGIMVPSPHKYDKCMYLFHNHRKIRIFSVPDFWCWGYSKNELQTALFFAMMTIL